jgi:DNA-binding SARP family transcriptional activator
MVIGHPAATSAAGHQRPAKAGPRSCVYRVSVLNGFEVRRDAAMLALPRGCQRLIALLALNARPILRSFVAGTLWTDATEARAGANLRTSIWRLHRPPSSLVLASASHIWLAPDVEVDIREACSLALRLLDDTAPYSAPDDDEETLSSDVLPDWYEDWVILAREQFRQLRLHALERLCERLIAAGSYGRAVRVGILAVAGEPLRESAQRSLVRAHLAEGNPSEAIRQYGLFRDLLMTELGVEPSKDMTVLVSSAGSQGKAAFKRWQRQTAKIE